jgi:hypothetical protein
MRISYPANATGAPGAGSWNIGECVNNTGANAINNNDFAMGYAYVVNVAVVTAPVPGPRLRCTDPRRLTTPILVWRPAIALAADGRPVDGGPGLELIVPLTARPPGQRWSRARDRSVWCSL